MNWSGRLTIFLLAVGLLASCASPVYVQTDESTNLAKYKTYTWVKSRSSQDDTRNLSAFAEQQIQDAVRAELAKRGWMEVNNDPDILLSYDVLVERTTQRQSDPVYTQPFTRVYYNPWLGRWGTIFYPSRFVGYDSYEVPVQEGTLTLTMMDAKTDKAVWQAWTSEELDNNKFGSEEVAKTVRNIFRKFD